MISLRKLWESNKEGSGDKEGSADLRLVQLLFQGIALHAVEGDPQDYEKFRTDMKALLDELDDAASPAVVLVTTGAALKALEDYNQRTSRWVRVQSLELHNMIAMLTKAILTMGLASERSVTRLQEIGGRIEKAVQIEDVRALKTRMEQCLDGIREEAHRQKAESLQAVEGLKNEISQTQERMRTAAAAAAAPARDPVTGLHTRVAAMAAFTEAAESSKTAYAALFVVDRVAAINARFGFAVGNQVMNLYLEELRKHLLAVDKIFRWNGPAFVALLVRPKRLEQISEQLRFVIPAKIERTVDLTNRTALVPISATWTVFPVALPIETLSEQLDQFVAGHWQPKES